MRTPIAKTLSWQLVLLTGLSVSIGWGIRGQFGHEYGAALAGALGGMAVALMSGRSDWQRRVHYFALFGAIGWGFGGSMSYMKNLAYAQSSDPATVLYGFASIFLIGFCWAAPGGAGTAIAAYFNREELTRFFAPLCAVFASWYLQDFVQSSFRALGVQPIPHWMSLETSAGLAILAITLTVLVDRHSWGLGSSLMLHMAVGWLAGFVLFTVILDLHLNPPREDVWGQCLGLIAGILVFCWRRDLGGIGFATVAAGFLGGVGFALGELLKLVGISSGLVTNWHSVMEQTQGLFHGIAIAISMGLLIARAPSLSDDPPVRRWTEVFSVSFVMVLLTYLNFRKSPNDWVKQITGLQPELYGIRISGNLMPASGFVGWFDFIYLAAALACIWLLVQHLRRPLPFLPESWLGRGQLFYLTFLWAIVTMNFIHVLPRFTPQRLVTEWFMTLNAIFCTVLVSTARSKRTIFLDRTPPVREGTVPSEHRPGVTPPVGAETPTSYRTAIVSERATPPYASWIRKAAILGVIGAFAITCAGWGVKLALFGDGPVDPKSRSQIRFGPNNTDTIK